MATINFNFEVIRSRSAFAWSIRAFSNRLLDWITSRVVLVFPESYSNVIPSLAISAALTCASVAIKTLSADWYEDQALVVEDLTWFAVSCKIKLLFSFLNLDFFRDATFSPPFIMGQVTVAFTDSSSISSTVEL